MKKRLLISCLLFFLPLTVEAEPTVKVSGFVRMDTSHDTRQGIAGSNCTYYIYPKKIECDDQCCDINAQGKTSLTPSVTRLRVTADGTQINNIDLSSLVELDFCAICSQEFGITRLRHAYLKADWKTKSLLVGQYWHPIYPLRCFADTVTFDGGSPIETYARYPQIRFDYHPGNFGLKLAAYSQFQYANNGPEGTTPAYMQNSMTPGLFGSVEIRKEKFFAGAGINMQRLLPSLSTTTTSTTVTQKTYVSNAEITSFIGTLYCSINIKDLLFKTKIAVGQNGYPFGTLGGYAVGCLNAETGKRCFENINFASWWGEIIYQKYEKMQPGIFFGVTRNLGTRNTGIYLDDEGDPIFYGYDAELHQVFHITPRIKSSFNHVHLGVEADFSKAWFGKMNRQGKQLCTNSVSNLRMLVAAWYTF